MHKLVVVVWDPRGRSRPELRETLMDGVAPDLLADGALRLGLCIADEAADVRGPSPFVPKGVPVALVNVWVSDPAAHEAVVARLADEGLRAAAYLVSETVYRDYGENEHADPRHWPDGEKSPGVTAVSFLFRPKRLQRGEWIRRWHGRMSPVSEEIQPRTRYVRNLVEEALTPDAVPFAGIVEEAWASPAVVADPFRFYGASNVFQLVKNMVRIVLAVTHFLDITKVQTVMMSEWFVKTESGTGGEDGSEASRA